MIHDGKAYCDECKGSIKPDTGRVRWGKLLCPQCFWALMEALPADHARAPENPELHWLRVGVGACAIIVGVIGLIASVPSPGGSTDAACIRALLSVIIILLGAFLASRPRY